MKTYRVHMEHWQRHLPTDQGKTFIEHLEVVVEAISGNAACKAARALLPEWHVRVVTIDRAVSEAPGEWG